MSAQPRRLGARLARSSAVVAGLGIAVFAVVAAAVLWRHEAGEERGEDPTEGDPADEVLTQMAIALACTTPVVVGAVVISTRRLAGRLTARIDGVIDQATRMSHHDLGPRLPVSASGDELDALATALNQLFDRLAHGIAAQNQFVADASHELRTPLTVLRTELEIARRHPRSPAEWEALADHATADVARMTEMVEALLRLARTGAGPAAREPVDGDALVDEVLARWTPLADGAGVRLERPAGDVGPMPGDAEALAVALGNLVRNAIQHSPARGVVAVSARRDGAHIELSVLDQGPGVAVADRDRIRLPFARGRGAADRDRGDGVGLGLSVADRIAGAHGGELRITDGAAGGACFVLRLPAGS